MAGLKELRNRLQSIKSTGKITMAMKLVSASKLRKAQQVLEKNKLYLGMLYTAVKRILASVKEDEIDKKIKIELPVAFQTIQNPNRYLLFVFSADRGLCGSYNQNVAKAAAERIRTLQNENKTVEVVCYGKKAYDILKKKYALLITAHFEAVGTGGALLEKTSEIAKYAQGKMQDFDVFEVIHSKFQSALSREMTAEQIYPFDENVFKFALEDENLTHVGSAYYDYKPGRMEILKALTTVLFSGKIYAAVLNAEASEQGARMAAMDNASNNAKDMISTLTLKYNTIRQSAITTELNEIISGAEAT